MSIEKTNKYGQKRFIFRIYVDFTRLFKKYYGKSPTEYKVQIRIDQAKNMLIETDMRIKAIAESVGYSDALYFSRAFKKECGYSPSEYRALEMEGLST